MINTIQAIVLGLTQGLTEYIPISSSAHLILLPKIFGWKIELENKFLFNIFIQTGTMCGLAWYYRKDIYSITNEFLKELFNGSSLKNKIDGFGWLIIFATVPTGLIAVFSKRYLMEISDAQGIISASLFCTSIILLLAVFCSKNNKLKRKSIRISDALIIGLIQIFSLIPGISRLGSTVSAGIILGLNQEIAIKFSFLISIPIALGASIVESIHIFTGANQFLFAKIWQSLFLGWLTSAISGYMVVRFLIDFLKKNSLIWFAIYCALAGSLIFIYM